MKLGNLSCALHSNRWGVWALGAVLLSSAAADNWGQTVATQAALDGALRGTNASAIWMDVADGNVVATFGRMVEETPGSSLKPFILLAALEAGVVREDTTVVCRGKLSFVEHGRRWNLACAHPRTLTVFAAKDALAYSCNTYFAHVAAAMPSHVLVRGLARFGIEPLEESRDAMTPESQMLLALGLAGVRVSPVTLASAYRRLAIEWAKAQQSSDPAAIVREGMIDSVRYGMADNAATPGWTIAGKTGTASNPGEYGTHGWFAGIVQRETREQTRGGGDEGKSSVVVVYVPSGSGADAALLARAALTRASLRSSARAGARAH